MTSLIASGIGLALAALLSTPALARVTELNITSVEPFAEGSNFGNAGAYERVKGTYKGEIDPADARNKVIVNIDKAPRNAAGRVEYEAEFYLLRPVESERIALSAHRAAVRSAPRDRIRARAFPDRALRSTFPPSPRFRPARDHSRSASRPRAADIVASKKTRLESNEVVRVA